MASQCMASMAAVFREHRARLTPQTTGRLRNYYWPRRGTMPPMYQGVPFRWLSEAVSISQSSLDGSGMNHLHRLRSSQSKSIFIDIDLRSWPFAALRGRRSGHSWAAVPNYRSPLVIMALVSVAGLSRSQPELDRPLEGGSKPGNCEVA